LLVKDSTRTEYLENLCNEEELLVEHCLPCVGLVQYQILPQFGFGGEAMELFTLVIRISISKETTRTHADLTFFVWKIFIALSIFQMCFQTPYSIKIDRPYFQMEI
jgi:hypothetical protein